MCDIAVLFDVLIIFGFIYRDVNQPAVAESMLMCVFTKGLDLASKF